MAITEDQILVDWAAYETYRDDTADWREQRDKCDKFTAGVQDSTTNSANTKAQNMSDIALNRLRPLLITRISAMIARDPTGVVYGTRKEDIAIAQTIQEFLDWHWYVSSGKILMERTVGRQQRNGIGWMCIYSDNIADYGRGELRFGDLSYRNVFTDKAAGAKPLFDDAPVIIVSKLMRPLDFRNSLPPDIRERIPQDSSLFAEHDEIQWMGKGLHEQDIEIGSPMAVTNIYDEEKGDWIRPLDVYRRKVVNVPILRQKLTGKVVKILDDEETLEPEEKVLLQKKIADAQLMQMGIDPAQIELFRLEKVDVPIWRVEYYQQISGKMLVPESEDILPISNYPVVPVVGDDTGNAMPLGEVDHMIGEQELLNACIRLTLLNAALASNWRVIFDQGKAHIKDVENIKQMFSVPGAWINMKTEPNGKFPIEIIRPEPLPAAWFTLLQYFSQAMEFQLSTFSFRTGDPSKAPDTLGATLQLGQWANDVLRMPLGRLELAIERLFNTLLEWMPHYYTGYKRFEIVGLDDKPIMREVNAPFFDEVNNAWSTMNSLEGLQANYRIRLGSTTPAQTVYELQVMQQLAQLQPALIGNVIDRLPGLRETEKAEIKQTINQVMQLSQANQEKEQVIVTLQKQLNRLNEMVVALQREQAVSKVEPEIAAFVADMRHQRDELRRAARNKNGNQSRKR